MKWLLVPFSCFAIAGLFGQSSTDSLLRVLPRLDDDSLKMQAYIRLEESSYRTDLNRALDYITKAEELATALEIPEKEAEISWRKSFVLTELKLFDKARAACEKALEIFSGLKMESWIADVEMQLGSLSKLEAKNAEATRHYLMALALARKIDDRHKEAIIYNYLGGLYKAQRQFDKALSNYERALALVRELDVKRGISACLTNIADTYNEMKQYGKALLYHRQALEIKRETGDTLGEARVLNSLGVVYNNLNKPAAAKASFQQALPLARQVGDEWLVSAIEYGLSQVAFNQGDLGESIKMQLQVLQRIDSLPDANFKLRVHGSLAEAYAKAGDYKNAFASLRQARAISDSIYNEKILTVTNDLEARYQNEQKTQQIALLDSEKELQALQLDQRETERNATIAFAVLIMLLAGLLYNQYRIKQKSNKELQDLDRLKSNFFTNISHEFRTPLTLIKGPIEHLEQNPEETLDREEIRMIRRNTNKVLGLVNQLLDLSRIDQGKLQLKPTEGNVFKCLRAAASSFNSHAAQRNIDYRVNIPQEVLWAAFDRDKLEKVVYNLLSNAFKFNENGEEVSFVARYEDEELQIQVSDSGRGISAEKLPFIFDRFYQVEQTFSRANEGSGIGLSLSKDLVELMDGTITVTSERGKGTHFTVHIPLEKIETRQIHPEDVPEKSEHPLPASRAFELHKADRRALPRILLVEDNADMREFIRPQLLPYYRILEAVNGQQGLKMAGNYSPDLIITDLMMPKMDGIALCDKLKSDLATSHIPIIMLTAKAGIENKIEGLETGADDYLTKPFDSRELLTRVANLIEQRRRLRASFGNQDQPWQPAKITSTSIDEKFLEKVLVLLEANYSDSAFGVPRMQESLAMSKSQLHRKIKALTNETPGELLRNFRLKRAAQLLSQNADTVTQIAYQVGFNDLSYFTKCFKSLFGRVPSAYKK